MKKLLLLPFVLISSVCLSQDTIKIPAHAAKLIIRDLVDYESVKKQLSLCKEQTVLAEKASKAKDTVLVYFKYKMDNCENRLYIEKERAAIYKDETKRLEKEYRKLKIKSTLTQIGSGAIIAILAYLLIMK